MSLKTARDPLSEEEREVFDMWVDRMHEDGFVFKDPHFPSGRNYLYDPDVTIKFGKARCTGCGRKGCVPSHHRFLCVVCHASGGNSIPHKVKQRGKCSKIREPLFSELSSVEPATVSKEIVYSSKDMSQAELRAILES